jgi:TerC family integral membrane protein
MEVSFAGWLALIAGLVVLLLLDLFVLHRRAEEVSTRDAVLSTAGFVAVAVAFGIGLGMAEGGRVAEQFFAGYTLELSLSVDNVFVWAVIFSAFSIPAAYQHRVLFYGIFSALILRGGFVAIGGELLHRFEWVVYVFGLVLVYAGARMLRGEREVDPQHSFAVRVVRRQLPTTRRLEGAHLFVPADRVAPEQRPERPPLLGRWYATPMLAVLAVIEISDIIFAVDSIPAIFGVTRETFIVFSATALALIGLRSMYFLLARMRGRFAYLDIGLAILLLFIGAKFMLSELVEIGTGVSLGVIVFVLASAIGASLIAERRKAAQRGG